MLSSIRSEKWLRHFVVLFLTCSCLSREAKTPAVTGKSNQKETGGTPIYIGEMYYFSETKEFYTPLFFNSDFNEEDSGGLATQSDSTVYEGNGITRKRIPMKKAEIAFMLAGLDSLFIYDSHNAFISRVALARVEYFENNGDRNFIAVYDAVALKRDPAERYYCTNNLFAERLITDFDYRVINDPSLDKFILHNLKRDQNIGWKVTNVEVLPGRAIYSIVNSSSESFITEWNDNHFNVVVNMNRGYRVEYILPLPFEFNQHPLMLISYRKYNEKKVQTSLAAFATYQEYKFMPDNRLKDK